MIQEKYQRDNIPQRIRGKIEYTCADGFGRFKELHPKEAKEIGVKKHNEIVFTADQIIADIILNEPLGFKLPERMGWLYIIKYKPKVRRTDENLSRQYDKKIVYINSHTYGYSYKFYWAKRGRGVRNITAYTFKACRKLKRNLAQFLFNKKGDFYEKISI